MRRGWWGAPSLGRLRGQGRVQGSRMGQECKLITAADALRQRAGQSLPVCATILAWARRGTGTEPAGWAALQDTGLDSGQTDEQAGGPSRGRNQLARLATHVPMPVSCGLACLACLCLPRPRHLNPVQQTQTLLAKRGISPSPPGHPGLSGRSPGSRTVCTPLPCLTKRRVSTCIEVPCKSLAGLSGMSTGKLWVGLQHVRHVWRSPRGRPGTAGARMHEVVS